jgi:AbiV family abortive infection protein
MRVEERLAVFKVEAYRNAVRLFQDAALLYCRDRYPSSFALAVTALEEIGKVHVIDRGCDMLCMNPHDAEEIYDMYFKSSWLTDHKHKQSQTLFDAMGKEPSDTVWKFVRSSGLEQARQQGLYVELQDKDIKTPARITREKAFDILKLCHEAFAGSGDIAFSGFEAYSTKKSEWLATDAIQAVLTSFNECKAHNTAVRADAVRRRRVS